MEKYVKKIAIFSLFVRLVLFLMINSEIFEDDQRDACRTCRLIIKRLKSAYSSNSTIYELQKYCVIYTDMGISTCRKTIIVVVNTLKEVINPKLNDISLCTPDHCTDQISDMKVFSEPPSPVNSPNNNGNVSNNFVIYVSNNNNTKNNKFNHDIDPVPYYLRKTVNAEPIQLCKEIIQNFSLKFDSNNMKAKEFCEELCGKTESMDAVPQNETALCPKCINLTSRFIFNVTTEVSSALLVLKEEYCQNELNTMKPYLPSPLKSEGIHRIFSNILAWVILGLHFFKKISIVFYEH